MVKRNLLLLTTAVATACLSSMAYAQKYDHVSQFYVEPAIGAWVDFSNNYGSAPIGSVSLGYSINNQFSVQVSPYVGATANAVMAEGIWDLPLKSKWTPYLAIGAGYAHMDFDTVGMDIGGGVHYQMAPNMDFSFNYRYLQAFDDDLNNGHIVTMGLKVYFGGASNMPSSMSDKQVNEQYAKPQGVSRCDESTLDSTRESVGCYTVSQDTVTMHLDVKFDFDRSTLTPSSKAAISRLASFMKQYPATNVVLYGYASWEGRGSKAYNKKLSLRRANSVRQYLNDLNINDSRIKTVGMGIANPMVSNKTEQGRAQNRRVEAAIDLPLK